MAAHRQRLRHDVPAEDHRAAGVRREERAEDPDQRRLAASVRAEDAGYTAGLDDEIQLVERDLVLPFAPPPGRACSALPAPKCFGDALQLDCCCGHCVITPVNPIENKKGPCGAQRPHGPSGACSRSFLPEQTQRLRGNALPRAVSRRHTPPSAAKLSSVSINESTPCWYRHTRMCVGTRVD